MRFHVEFQKHHQKQLSFLIACFLDCATTGASLGYSATLLPQLESPESSIKVTPDESIWIASILLLGIIPGSLIGGYVVEKLGRRISYMMVAAGNTAGWTLLAFSTTSSHLLIARFINGVALGASYPAAYMYLVEVSSTERRGIWLSLMVVGGIVGVQIIDLLGSFVHWQLAAFICLFLPLAYLIILFFLEDGYVWYLNREDRETALRVFKYYRGESKEALQEFEETEENIKNRPVYTTREVIELFSTKAFLKPCFIITFYLTMVNFCGGTGIIFYSITIMKQVTNIDEYLGTAILDAVRTLATIVAAILIDRFYRRTVTNIGGAACLLSLIALTVFLYLFESLGDDVYGTGSLVCMMIYTFIYFVSLMPMSNVVMGELLTGPTRSFGMSFTTVINYVLYYIFVTFLPSMFDVLGASKVFAIFGACSLLGSIGLYFILPETKSKSSVEIENSFKAAPSNVVV